MCSPHFPLGEVPEDPPNSSSAMASISEVVDSVQLVPNLDGGFVQPPSPAATGAEAIFDILFESDVPQEGPGLSSSLQVVNDNVSSVWPLALSSDQCVSWNSSRVSAMPPPPPPPEALIPVATHDITWLFSSNDEGPSKDEDSDSAVVPSMMIGAGLANLGNTCFLNSILQCFTHTVPLIQRLLMCTHSVSRDGHDGFCVLCAFRDHIGRSLKSSGRVISPLILVENLNSFSSMFRRHQQEDAHEFMQCALDKLERCFLDLKKNSMSFEDDNIVEKVFGGRLVSKLRCCNCGRSSDTFEPLIDLSLEIENVNTLSSALESFTTVENIDAKFRCDGCKEEVSMEKQLMLDQTPSIATFHLKRFKTDGRVVEKIDKHINFPLELDLQPYTISNENENVSLKYDLYAVIVHMGSSSTSGHYFCYVRTAPDTWHDLDDAKVTKVSGEYVLSQEAYILFYAQQGTPWFSSIVESLIPCLDPKIMNTSPKSVLDIGGDGLSKPNPILNTNIERSEASKSKESSEQLFDFSCQEKQEFLEIDDNFDTSHGCGQFPSELKQETANLNGSKDISTQLPPENNAVSTGIAMLDGNSHIESGASETNNCGPEVVDFREKDGFHPLTPPSSPTDAPDTSFQISRDHLKKENQGSSEKSSSKSKRDPKREVAMQYLRRLGSRRSGLLDYIHCSPENKRKKMDSPQSKKDNDLSARKKPNGASVGRPVAAGSSQ